jgi:hypothetical protein
MNWSAHTLALLLAPVVPLVCLAAAKAVPPIVAIEGAQPKPTVFDAAKRDAPLVIRSKDKAANYFAEDALAALSKQVDFEQQFVLIFAWRGSGQDRLSYAVAESFPEQILFTLTPGRTRDLRPHVYVYALRSNVKWTLR